MKKRIFASIFLTTLLCVVLVAVLVIGGLYSTMDERATETLRQESLYISAGYKATGLHYLEGTRSGANRVTLVAPNGQVLFDNREDPAGMDNHLNRPEVAAAFAGGTGQAFRLSDTRQTKTIYYALLLDDGNVLRLASTADSAFATMLDFLPLLVVVAVAAAVLAAILAGMQTRKILAPLNALNLDAPLENDAYGELSPLLRRIETQRVALADKSRELDERQAEFTAVTDNLSEGLVLLSARGTVLSINQCARRILQTGDGDLQNRPLLDLYRSLELDGAARRAIETLQRQEIALTIAGNSYRAVLDPVDTGEAAGGAVLLLSDETEKLRAEAMRREFTANVSHELKTPLTSISGYAEIMRNGLAKPEDLRTFAGRIGEEAGRLVALVDDILHLSRLDEAQPPVDLQPVALLPLAQDVCERMQPLAQEADVTLTVGGEALSVPGNPTVLEEIIHNLVENAIKYNRPGGVVKVDLAPEGDGAMLRVQDNGIGIPAAAQNRVFERFYRVDKSHSKETGGTGLGLSIAKHGAQYHGGRIELTSREGTGTCVQVWLPG